MYSKNLAAKGLGQIAQMRFIVYIHVFGYTRVFEVSDAFCFTCIEL